MQHSETQTSPPLQGSVGLAARSLIGACLAMLLNPSSMLLLSFGIYVLPIVADTGWDKTVVASAIGPTIVIAGLMSPLVGWAAGRLGPRLFLSIAYPLFGLALMMLAASGSAGMFALLLAFAGVLVSGQTMVPYAYCIAGWFEARRGMALGVMLACTGFGIAAVPPIVARLLDALGWRMTFVSLGVVVLAVGTLVVRSMIFDPPAAAAVDREQVPGVTWQRALKMPAFWLLGISIFLIGSAGTGGMVNLFGMLTERGVPRQSASFIMSVVGISMIVARLVFGYLFDRVSAHRVLVLICVLMGAAFVVLASSTGPVGVVLAAVLIGIGFGAEGDALTYMTSRLFGMRDFAKIFGILFMVFTFGGGAGPVLFAVLKGQSGSHQTALWAAAAACGLAATLALLIQQRDLVFGRRAPQKQTSTGTNANAAANVQLGGSA